MTPILYLTIGLIFGAVGAWLVSKAHNFEKDAFIAGYAQGFSDCQKIVKKTFNAVIREAETGGGLDE